jgi:hypothetical protein
MSVYRIRDTRTNLVIAVMAYSLVDALKRINGI